MENYRFGIRKTYTTQKLINEGGFGVVYQLDDPGLVCKFSIEENDISLQQEIDIFELIQKRCDVQKFLKNYIRIPKIIEYGNCYMNDKNISYIVMEKLGPDLTNLKDITFTTELNRIYAILRAGLKILKGLYVLHKYFNLVHGDIKPSNFLFEKTRLQDVDTDEIAFIDLGLAKPVHKKIIQTSGINGTRSYSSIHVQKNFLPTPRCDLESLGYVLLHFIDHVLPWNQEIKNYIKKNPQLKKNPEQLKIKKEHISLGQKRFLRDRIIKEKYNTDGELLLADYFYIIYNLSSVPEQKVYKTLCKFFYDTLKKLQKIAIDSHKK